MEFKGNLTLKYIWNVEKPETSGTVEEMSKHSPDQKTKAIAFLILAGVEAAFVIGCLVCANISKKSDEAEEEENINKAKNKEYQSLGQEEQIVSWSNWIEVQVLNTISIKHKIRKKIKALTQFIYLS